MVLNGVADTTCARIPYHTAYDTNGDGMAVLNRCPGSFPSQLAMFTAVAAHEIAEATTDSNPLNAPAWELWVGSSSKPWESSVWNEVEMENGTEIGDLLHLHARRGERLQLAAHLQQRQSSASGATHACPPCPFLSSV